MMVLDVVMGGMIPVQAAPEGQHATLPAWSKAQ